MCTRSCIIHFAELVTRSNRFLLSWPPLQALTCILDGLADEAEGVRDAALSSGRVAVELYAESALPLVLPAVEAGILSPNWRIRQSSVELLGDLLFKVKGATGAGRGAVYGERGGRGGERGGDRCVTCRWICRWI